MISAAINTTLSHFFNMTSPKESSNTSNDKPLLSPQEAKKEIQKILLEEFELASPDDVAFLRLQVHCIAERIADRLYHHHQR